MYSDLIAEGVIPGSPLKNLYIDDDTLQIEPESAIELHFDPQTMRLEEIGFILMDEPPGGFETYTGELPIPFFIPMDKAHVRHFMGAPIPSYNGFPWNFGNDRYLYRKNANTSVFVDIQYSRKQEVERIHFLFEHLCVR
ncbi:TPA: hypothetical protein L5621_006630 [Pseudomonas aeruginosa]|nr:hypothetical protein [Pseudomonas aeruginosa]